MENLFKNISDSGKHTTAGDSFQLISDSTNFKYAVGHAATVSR